MAHDKVTKVDIGKPTGPCTEIAWGAIPLLSLAAAESDKSGSGSRTDLLTVHGLRRGRDHRSEVGRSNEKRPEIPRRPEFRPTGISTSLLSRKAHFPLAFPSAKIWADGVAVCVDGCHSGKS